MTLHLYTTLRTWRRARQDQKAQGAAAPMPKPTGETRGTAVDAAIYAAGIACAGQVPEQPGR